jgi:Ca2+-binding RTX toxin-like protein
MSCDVSLQPQASSGLLVGSEWSIPNTRGPVGPVSVGIGFSTDGTASGVVGVGIFSGIGSYNPITGNWSVAFGLGRTFGNFASILGKKGFFGGIVIDNNGVSMAVDGGLSFPMGNTINTPAFSGVGGNVTQQIFAWDDLGNFANRAGECLDDRLDAASRLFGSSYISPIIVDMDGDGLELTRVSQSNVNFDLDNNGIAERTGWLKGDDAFVVRDLNNNGVIDNQREMLGVDSVSSALDKLKAYDTNNDGFVAGAAEFGNLRLWRDVNQNGRTDSGELKTLTESGIGRLPTAVTDVNQNLQGNVLDWKATWLKPDGTAGFTFGDVFFQTNQLNGWYVGQDTTQTPTINPEALLLPLSRSYGALKPLHLAATDSAPVMTALKAVDTLSIQTMSQANNRVLDLLYKWAGVSAVVPESGSIYYDARVIGFLEKFYNQDFKVTGGIGAGNDFPQTPFSTDQLSDVFAVTYQVMKSRLLVQGALKTVFEKAYYSFESDSIVFNESSANILTRAKTLAAGITSSSERFAFWQEVGGVLRVHAEDFNSTAIAMQTAVNTAAGMSVPLFDAVLGGQTRGENFQGSVYNDLISVGAGNDTVAANNGDDSVRGGDGDDSLSGGSGNDTVLGEAGNDSIYGNNGSDSLIGGVGADYSEGGAGIDTYRYAKGDGLDRIRENGISNEQDTLIISGYTMSEVNFTRLNATDLVVNFNGSSTDRITVAYGLENGDDTLEQVMVNGVTRTIAQLRTEVLAKQTTTGNDTIAGYSFQANTIAGGAGNDSITGGDLADSLSGDAGNDTIVAWNGNDTVVMGVGNDSVLGKNGNDVYRYVRGDGSDTIFDDGLSADADVLEISGYASTAASFSKVGTSLDLQINFTGSTTDVVRINQALESQGDGTLETVRFADGTSRTIAQLRTEVLAKQTTTGNDTIAGYSFQANTIAGGAGNDSITGGDLADSLSGDAGNDTIIGDSGNDRISGLDGADSLNGGLGDDTIIGGLSKDSITAGSGRDVIVIASVTESSRTAGTADIVTDFRAVDDTFDFSAMAFTALDTDGGNTEVGELRLAYNSVTRTTSILSDQTGFEVILNGGDYTTTITDTDFLW